MTRRFDSRLPQRRTAAVALWSLANGAAVLSIGLRLADAIPTGTSAAIACLLAISLLALNAAGLWLCRDDLDRLPTSALPAAGLAGAIGPVLAGFTWTPAGAVFPLVWCTLLLLGSVSGAIVWAAVRGEAADDASGEVPPAVATAVEVDTLRRDASTAIKPVEQPPAPSADVPAPPSPPDDPAISFQMTRRSTGDGETIEIATRLTFLPGERQISVHLPIAPPLASAPEVECEPVDDSDVELTVGAVYAYGVRIDARRPLPADDPLTVTLAVLLAASRPDRAAA